jgi:hypothetical protein
MRSSGYSPKALPKGSFTANVSGEKRKSEKFGS